MMRTKFSSYRRASSLAIHILSGAVGVLTGLQHLLSAKERTKRAPDPESNERVQSVNHVLPTEQKRDYFSIRRTKSELGYVYWVLQGHGQFQCFALLDTWAEAVDEACRRALDGCPSSPGLVDMPVLV